MAVVSLLFLLVTIWQIREAMGVVQVAPRGEQNDPVLVDLRERGTPGDLFQHSLIKRQVHAAIPDNFTSMTGLAGDPHTYALVTWCGARKQVLTSPATIQHDNQLAITLLHSVSSC